MEQKKTIALRPVSSKLNECLGNIPSGPFNFGLYFNKWFCIVDKDSNSDSWDRGEQWKCSLNDLTRLVSKEKTDFCHPNLQLENLSVSIALFNGKKTVDRDAPKPFKDGFKAFPSNLSINSKWDHTLVSKLLKSKHHDLENIERAFSNLGYLALTFELPMASSLVIGSGNEHPSEKGFLFEWNMGIPYIPASSIKGVVRLAAAVNGLNAISDDESQVYQYVRNLEKDETIPEFLRALFGAGGDNGSTRGKVIFLDAYPASMPLLEAEIMNCHYPDYLNDSSKGPTEDQNPNPQKYWAVSKLDRFAKPLRFVFRMLLAPQVATNSELKSCLENAFLNALLDHGLGAKTAVGHGRFLSSRIPSAGGQQTPDPAVSVQQNETWEKARLVFDPGRKEITATDTSGAKKATTKDLSVVPKSLEKKLLNKPKNAVANVQVECKGANYYSVIKIEG